MKDDDVFITVLAIVLIAFVVIGLLCLKLAANDWDWSCLVTTCVKVKR
jgi:hypothetical protein